MLYTGVVRIPMGVIAVYIVLLLIKGEWILGSLDGGLLIWSMYLFAFIAGFSEMFVPNALKQVEAKAAVETPTGQNSPGGANGGG